MPARNDVTRGTTRPTEVPIGAQAQSDSAAPENSIRPAVDRTQARPTAEATPETPKKTKSASVATSVAMPDHMLTRYVQVDDRYHFANGQLAFRAGAKRISTPLENTEVIADMIEIAKARGWKSVQISGTETYRKEAWQQAQMAGLTVPGYRASKLEQALLDRRMGRDREPAADRNSAAEKVTRQPTNRVDSPPASPERVYTGKLMAHGIGAHNFDPLEEPSYFVRLETSGGPHVLWGKDLQRAIQQSLSKAAVGDQVTLRDRGEQAITVSRPIRDPDGHLGKDTRVKTHLSQWSVETVEFLRDRTEVARWVRDANVDPRTAIAKYPALAGTYIELHVAKLKAKEQFKAPADQDRFLTTVRQKLADSIERGEPLSTARVQSPTRSPGQTTPRKRERQQERTL